jgi:multimeric flavodoxin WrbA
VDRRPTSGRGFRRGHHFDTEGSSVKILAFQGSPREKGNTQAVLGLILGAAEEAGAQTESVLLAKLGNLSGCRECFVCQTVPDAPNCSIQDDMQPWLSKAIEADVLVWATPVFCWSVAWPLKMAMDRFFSMFKFEGKDKHKCLLAGRKMCGVITAGGGEDEGADLASETMRRLAMFSSTTWLGAFVAPRVKSPEAIREDAALCDRARAFGQRITS